jgi:hypothetical protein
MTITLDLLQLFGEASGLKTNMQKSNVYPIQCTESDITTVQEYIPCELFDLPSKYVGLPLSLKKLTKTKFSLLLTRSQTVFQDGKADLLTPDGRRILVQFVITSMLVYLAMAVDNPPQWAIKEIDKIRRRFFSRRKKANSGHCLVAWLRTCNPPE